MNIYDTVAVSIGNVNFADRYFDVYIQNPGDFVVGYEMNLHGVTIDSVENLVTPTWYPVDPQWQQGGNKVISLSYQDSVINKYWNPTPLFRVYYQTITDTMICIENVVSIVNDKYEEVIPRIDGGCVAATPDGIEEHLKDMSITLVPNPFTNRTEVTFENTYNLTFDAGIYDITGKLVRKIGTIIGNKFSIDRGNLASGAYYLSLRSQNGGVARAKLVIQ